MARNRVPPLKILVIVSCFPPSRGGVENSSYRLALGMARSGHDVTVITSSRGKPCEYTEELMGPLKVIRYPERYFFFEAPLVPKIALKALTMDYDVLHVHGMTPPLTDLAILFAKLRRKPVVLTYHNDAHLTIPSKMGHAIEAIYSRFAIPFVGLSTKIVSTTHSYAATSPILKHFMDKVVVIPWGIESRAARSSGSGNGNDKRLLFVGQMKEYKGVNVLLEAVAHLNREGHGVSADIVGDGPYLSSLRTMAEKLSLGGKVRFWGEMNDEALGAMFDSCDALVLPSVNRREAFGLVQLEAFAAGRTVVASDIPGVKDVAAMGRGYLARPNDVHSLSENISRALKFPVESKHMQRVAETLNWKNVVGQYERVLDDAFQGKNTIVPAVPTLVSSSEEAEELSSLRESPILS